MKTKRKVKSGGNVKNKRKVEGKKTKIIFWAPIIAAISFFFYSIIQLIGYGFSTGVIDESYGSLLVSIANNFAGINSLLICISLISISLIYIGFIILAQKIKFLKISAYALLITNIFFFIISLLVFSAPSIYQALNLNLNTIGAITGFVWIYFGITLLFWKNKNYNLHKVLGVFYILEGIVLFTALFMPLRVVDFTIAIRILESALFLKFKEDLF